MAASIRKKSLHSMPAPPFILDTFVPPSAGAGASTSSIASSSTLTSSTASTGLTTPLSTTTSLSSTSVPLSTPIAQNTLLNKGASSTSGLYQQCSLLRARLARLHGFAAFFPLSSLSPSLFSSYTPSNPPSAPAKRDSSNPVTQLWDLFKLGIPLVYIYNLSPPQGSAAIAGVGTDPLAVKQGVFSLKDAKHATAMFIMAISKLSTAGAWGGGPMFNVSELMGEDTNGFVKVVQAVAHLLDLLPRDLLPEPSLPSADAAASTSGAPGGQLDESERKKKVRQERMDELLTTERKYIQDLEALHTYSQVLVQSRTVSQDTAHDLFSNLKYILDQQRYFLIELEKTAELPAEEQNLGAVFTSGLARSLFETYIPYCRNFLRANELALEIQEQLMQLPNAMIDARGELQAFLIKPIQRLMKYPLLIAELLKVIPKTFPFYPSLQQGHEAALHYLDEVNEAQRSYENVVKVQNLLTRVEDWKGHRLENFGQLVLDDVFVVTKGEADREYHVFLFEKIILCCKEQLHPGEKDKKKLLTGKNGSLLRKPTSGPSSTPSPSSFSSSTLAGARNPLTLKGRIYLNNITSAKQVPPAFGAYSGPGHYALLISWNGDADNVESLVVRCPTEEKLRKWENGINKLLQAQREKRRSEREARERAQSVSQTQMHERGFSVGQGSAPPMLQQHPYIHRPESSAAMAQQQLPMRRSPMPFSMPASGSVIYDSSFLPDERAPTPSWEPPRPMMRRDHASSASVPRGTQDPIVVPPRARTEGTDGPTNSAWRGQYAHVAPPPLPRMMSNQSAVSTMSEASFGNGPSGSPVVSQGQPGQPFPAPAAAHYGAMPGSRTSGRTTPGGYAPLQQPQSRLRMQQAYAVSNPEVTAVVVQQPPRRPGAPRSDSGSMSTGSRSRSSSTPAPYVPSASSAPRDLPPVPVPPPISRNPSGVALSGQVPLATIPQHRHPHVKRESGSSQSTGEEGTDDDSPTFPYQSPDTPFGSNDTSLLATAGMASPTMTARQHQQGEQMTPLAQFPPYAHDQALMRAGHQSQPGPVLRTARSQVFPSRTRSPFPSAPQQQQQQQQPQQAASQQLPTIREPVTVKVAFRQDLFMIQVPRSVGHQELMDKVWRKIQLCAGKEQMLKPLRIKYQDEEGDLISLGGMDDWLMALELATLSDSNLVKLFVV